MLRMVVFNDGCLNASTVHAVCSQATSASPAGAFFLSSTAPSTTEASAPGAGAAGSGAGTDGSCVWQSAALVAVALRLGLACINPEYLPPLLDLLRVPHCVGCIGGRPNHSVFIVGTRGDESLVYLDPHTNQTACPSSSSSSSLVTGDSGVGESSEAAAGNGTPSPGTPSEYDSWCWAQGHWCSRLVPTSHTHFFPPHV
jgi:hypothetical protein